MRKDFIPKLRAGRKPEGEAPGQRTERISGDKFVWLNLQNPDRQYVEGLAREHGLNALNVEDCLAKFELPKIDVYDDHIFLILHFPPLASKNYMPKHSQLSVFMGRDFLVTVHQGDLKPLVDLAGACRGDSDPDRKQRLLKSSTAVLLHEIIDALVDDLLHTLRRIMASMEDVEDGAFDEKRSVAKKISILRREITMLRRIAVPLKRITTEAARQVPRFSVAEDLTLYFDDVVDHVDKVIESLEEARETMEIYKDTDYMLNTEKTNKVLAVLTIIFTLTIPATVIGTFYGMNVSLPGGLEEGGDYTAFVMVILASAIPAAVMFGYFRRLGWLRA